MKILLSAYSCEPGRGSEPGIGWHTARELARYHDVWVLIRPDADRRAAIEAELARSPIPTLHLIYCPLPVQGGWWRLGTAAFVLHYYLWQIRAYFVARRLHREVGFDVAHHITFGRYSSPSFLALLPIPFVWGPVGGGEAAPKPFWKDFHFKAKLYEVLRLLSHRVGEYDPWTRLTARRSAVVHVTTEATARRVQRMAHRPVEIRQAIGLSSEEIAHLAQCPSSNSVPLRFISIGRLLHWKGFYLGLRAFARTGLETAEYWLLGDGPERQRLQTLAAELGIAHRVTFWGQLSREETLRRLGACHVLVHPSLHDSGGWVCSEGMAAGRPIICLDLGGPAVQVTPETGIKVPAHDPEQAVKDLAEAMVRLANDVSLRLRMGRAGRRLVQEVYNWEVKGRALAQLLESVRQHEGTAARL